MVGGAVKWMKTLTGRLINAWNWLVPAHARALRWAWAGMVAVWVVTMLLTPILIFGIGDHLFPAISTVTVLLQLAASLLALRMGYGLRQVGMMVVVSAVLTYSVELLGSKTGFPFGPYHYTDALKPHLFGVPILIPLAWLMMLPASWGVASLIAGEKPSKWVYAGLSGLVFTAWDLYLDPQMVLKGLWVWHEPSGYFGIPWSNYLGWWATASLLTLILLELRLLPINAPDHSYARRPLLVIYSITWVFQVVALGVFWEQPGPALAGFAGMGVFALWAWRKALMK